MGFDSLQVGTEVSHDSRSTKVADRKRAALGELTNLTSTFGLKEAKSRARPEEPKAAGGVTVATQFAWASGLSSVDAGDAGNVQAVAEYAEGIQAYLRDREQKVRPPDYMELQKPDITEKMRSVLVDWLVEVHHKFKLHQETLFLAVALLDRYLSEKKVKRDQLQLIGVVSMLLAAKHEEIYPPEIKDFVHVTDKSYTREEILEMEVTVLNTLKFQITLPTPLPFVKRLLKIQGATAGGDQAVLASLVDYLVELTLANYRSIRHSPSVIAAAGIFLANKIYKVTPAWPPCLEEAAYPEGQIKGCAKEMCTLLQGAEKATLQAVRKKYSHAQYHKVAKMVA